MENFSPTPALAGQTLTINGQGFAPSATDNLVRVGGVEARVTSATATQLSVLVPFGAESGPVSVRTPRGETISRAQIALRTSVSGIIEDTRRQPLAGIAVRVVGTGIAATTNAEGSFLLPDVAPGNAREIEIDGATGAGSLPYPKVRLKLRVLANRDNQFAAPVALQQPAVVFSLAVSGSNLFAGTVDGVYVTANQGESWTLVKNGLTNPWVWSLAVIGATVFAGTDGGGVFATINQGQSWAPVNAGLTNVFVDALAVQGANLAAGTRGGVMVSANQRQSWTAANRGLKLTTVTGLGTLGATLYAGTSADGAHLSVDQGQN